MNNIRISLENGTVISIESDEPSTKFNIDTKDKYGKIFEVGEAIDAWVSADYHFGKFLRKEGEEKDALKLEEEKIIELHNSKVKKDDLFLFLGDISESEFGDEARTEALTHVMNQIKRLNGRKIILPGNNDTCDDLFYKNCGFELIFRRDRIITSKHVFSHFPVNMRDNSRINIHGHIHGSFKYFECDPENHVDCYWKLWNGPLRISELDELVTSGKYKGELEVSTKSEGNDITL